MENKIDMAKKAEILNAYMGFIADEVTATKKKEKSAKEAMKKIERLLEEAYERGILTF